MEYQGSQLTQVHHLPGDCGPTDVHPHCSYAVCRRGDDWYMTAAYGCEDGSTDFVMPITAQQAEQLASGAMGIYQDLTDKIKAREYVVREVGYD